MAALGGELNKARIPYMVIGGQAVLRHGWFRVTDDVDITLGVAPADMGRVLHVLERLRFTPLVDDAREFVKQTHLLPCHTDNLSIRLDLSFTDSAYELQAIARGIDVVVRGTPVRFASAEDLIIHKIIAGRGRDIDDVRSVLLKNPGVDDAYIRGWIERFAEALEEPLMERYDAVRREAEL